MARHPKNQRRLLNYIVSGKQLRLVFLCALAFAAGYFILAVSAGSSLLSRIATASQRHEVSPLFQHSLLGSIQDWVLSISLSGTVLTFLIALIMVFLTHKVYGPLVSIHRFVKSLRGGDYSARLQLRPSDELQELATDLNDLAETLERRQKGEKGFSLIELMVMVALLGIVMMAASAFFTQQLKANNFLEFQLKKEQLKLAIIGQVLPNPAHCKCLFANAADFPVSGGNLTGYPSPTSIGKFAQEDCIDGIPVALVTVAGVDGLRLLSVGLKNITLASGTYSGSFAVNIESSKEVLGPKQLQFQIPVNVLATSAAPGQMQFEGCTTSSAGGLGGSIIQNWPDVLKCGDTVWTVYREGKYHCYGGGESSTRSAIMTFNSSTRTFSGVVDNTDNGKCGPNYGDCTTKTIDELIATGLAK